MADQPVASVAKAEATVPGPQLGVLVGVVCLLLGLYLLVVSAASLVGIYDIRTNNLAIATTLGLALPKEVEALADVRIALLTMFGASLGACLLSFLGLFRYAVLGGNFTLRFFGSYLVGPSQ